MKMDIMMKGIAASKYVRKCSENKQQSCLCRFDGLPAIAKESIFTGLNISKYIRLQIQNLMKPSVLQMKK